MWNKVGVAQWEHAEYAGQQYLVLDAPEGDRALLVELHDGTMHVYETGEPLDVSSPLEGAQFIWTAPHDEHTPWLRTCTLIEAESAMRKAAQLCREQET